jgi:hypothetical protein
VENIGDGLDFYTITANSSSGWIVDYDEGLHYSEMGETISIDIELWIPFNITETTDQLEFTLTSVLDNSVTVSGNILTSASAATDADLDDNSILPDKFRLYQNYPNPFNPATTIMYNLPGRSAVNLYIYDMLGRKVSEFDLGIKSAGTHSYTFEGKTLSSGVYFYKIETDDFSDMKRMLLLK